MTFYTNVYPPALLVSELVWQQNYFWPAEFIKKLNLNLTFPCLIKIVLILLILFNSWYTAALHCHSYYLPGPHWLHSTPMMWPRLTWARSCGQGSPVCADNCWRDEATAVTRPGLLTLETGQQRAKTNSVGSNQPDSDHCDDSDVDPEWQHHEWDRGLRHLNMHRPQCHPWWAETLATDF